jgi:hypothetical protein
MIILAVILLQTGITWKICAQDTIPKVEMQVVEEIEKPTTQEEKPTVEDQFKPNPKTAYLIALACPGLGQIYNRQYWKLPVVYGGFVACLYAITWNDKTYQDYRNAYFDIMKDVKNDPTAQDPGSWSQSWQDFIPAGSDPAARLTSTTFHSNLKRGKDYYRRYRDLSVIIGLGIYLIFVADSYVDAQMFSFDVSPALSLQLTPEIRPETINSPRSYALNVSLTF